MTKIVAIMSTIDIDKYELLVDGYIYGLKDYSVNMPFELTLEEIKNLKTDKDLFIAINKNIYSHELDRLKDILKELDKLNLKGILFADNAILNLKKRLNFKTDLVWSHEHFTTNYQSINQYKSLGCKYTYISSDITLKEIEEIIKNTNQELVVPIFGHLPIFTSKRHIVKNYLDNFNLKDNSKINYIEKENKIYPIIDNKEGTVVYSSQILNGYKEYLNLNVSYVTLNSFNIEEEKFLDVLKTFKEKKANDLEFENSNKGFLYKETTYKVR